MPAQSMPASAAAHPLNDRVISAEPQMLHSARRIILASGGWEKAAAVKSALLLLEPEVLITVRSRR